jgi:amino acid transporter
MSGYYGMKERDGYKITTAIFIIILSIIIIFIAGIGFDCHENKCECEEKMHKKTTFIGWWKDLPDKLDSSKTPPSWWILFVGAIIAILAFIVCCVVCFIEMI